MTPRNFVISRVSSGNSSFADVLVGNDLRKAAVDGWPVDCAIASDLQQGPYAAGEVHVPCG